MTTQSFKDFTNKYPLTKTERFELKRAFLNDNGEIYTDKSKNTESWKKIVDEQIKINEARAFIKPLIDTLHRKLLEEFLESFSLDESKLSVSDSGRSFSVYEIYERLKKGDAQEKKKKRTLLKKVEKQLADHFAKELAKFSSDVLVGVKVDKKGKKKEFNLSKENLVKGEPLFYLMLAAVEHEDFTDFKDLKPYIEIYSGLTGALKDLAENRKHYYGAQLKHGQYATRYFKDNLEIFLQNEFLFEEKIKKHLSEFANLSENEEIFDTSGYGKFVTDKGIKEYNEKIAKINSELNRIIQNKPELKKELPRKLSPLFESIGSEKEQRFESIDSLQELVDLSQTLKGWIRKSVETQREFFKSFFSYAENDEDLEKIYIKKNNITKISQEILADWRALSGAYEKKDKLKSFKDIKEYIEQVKPRALTQGTFSWSDFINAWKKNEFALLDGGEAFTEVKVGDIKKKNFEKLEELEEKFDGAIEKLSQFKTLEEAKKSLGDEYENLIADIKNYLDRAVAIIRRPRVFGTTSANKNGAEELLDSIDSEKKHEEFYESRDMLFSGEGFDPREIDKAYNKIRNFLRKEEKNPEELRIYYSSAFLEGWDVNKVGDKLGFFVKDRKDNIYLAVSKMAHQSEIGKYVKKAYKNPVECDGDFCIALVKTMGDPGKDVTTYFRIDGKVERKVKDIDKVREQYWDPEIYKMYKEVADKYDGKGFTPLYWTKEVAGEEKLNKFISYFAELAKEYQWENNKLQLQLKDSYNSWQEFIDDIKRQAYIFKWHAIEEAVVKDWIEDEKIFLFKVCNKDLCPRSGKNTGKWNAHTIIFKELFSNENISQTCIPTRLGAYAKIFVRPAKEQERLIESKDKEGRLLKREDGSQEYEHHRYSETKFIFHIPVFLNQCTTGSNNKTEFNREISKVISSADNLHIIGVDRGEKHLLYKSVIDKEGNIVLEPHSLNEIDGVDYKKILKEAEKQMDENTKRWLTVGDIKTKKEGYLSKVMGILSKDVVNNNAIVVLEDLNFGFARKRGGQFKASVYQQFQAKLLSKLGFLIDKDRFLERAKDKYQLKEEVKGKLSENTPQLTESDTEIAFSDLRGQHGVVFFINPAHTSTTCPKCGWFKEINNVHYSGIKNTAEEYNKNGFKIFKKDDYFEIEYKVTHETKDENKRKIKKEFTRKITTNVDRWYFDSSSKTYHFISSDDLNKFLEKLFTTGFEENEFTFFTSKAEGFGLNDLEGGLFEKIYKKQENETNWKAFVFAINRVFAIRNNVSEKYAEEKGVGEREQDFAHCPECGFDTRKDDKIKDGDALGAYNIARKGQIVLQRIKENPDNPDLNISRYDWMRFVKD